MEIGDDDDCDFVTDESDEPGGNIDFLLSIDNSGSMGIVRTAVRDTICQWSVEDRWVNSRFAVIIFGTLDANNSYMTVVSDFSDAATICSALTSFMAQSQSGGVEYQIDSVVRTNVAGNTMFLNWSLQNQKKVIIFTDEHIQSQYIDPITVITEDCFNYDYTVSAFISGNISDYNSWQFITQECGGFLEFLSNQPDDMIEKLNYFFGEQC